MSPHSRIRDALFIIWFIVLVVGFRRQRYGDNENRSKHYERNSSTIFNKMTYSAEVTNFSVEISAAPFGSEDFLVQALANDRGISGLHIKESFNLRG